MKMQLLLGIWPTRQCAEGWLNWDSCSQTAVLKMTGGNRLDCCCLAIGMGGFVLVMHMHYMTGGDMP